MLYYLAYREVIIIPLLTQNPRAVTTHIQNKCLISMEVTFLGHPVDHACFTINKYLYLVVCLNVQDMTNALKSRRVDGLVVDTYVAGAKKKLFSEFFRIRKIFDRKFSYGVVLAGDAIKLQQCFKTFVKANQHLVYEELFKVVDVIEVRRMLFMKVHTTWIFFALLRSTSSNTSSRFFSDFKTPGGVENTRHSRAFFNDF